MRHRVDDEIGRWADERQRSRTTRRRLGRVPGRAGRAGCCTVLLTDDYALDHSANALGAANDGTPSAWWITAYAFCADA